MSLRHWKAALVAFACIATLHAFGANPGADEYQKRLKVYQTVQPLGQSPFGEQINLYTGETTFVQTDVTFAGTGLPIEVTRAIGKPPDLGRVAMPLGFGGWELQLPYMETLTAGRDIGWQTTTAEETPTTNRCSTNFKAMFNPPERYGGQAKFGGFDLQHWWRGYQLQIPGAGRQEVLARVAGDTRKPDQGLYPAVTYRFWQVGCLPATSNGHAGEAFVVVSPEGTKYYLDHFVDGPYRTLQQNVDPLGGKPLVFELERRIARMYASRIEDRFGNWLTYRWEGERVVEMRASDAGEPERVVALDWVDDRIHAVRMQPGSAGQRTWSYAYDADGSLASVTLPDTSTWIFVGSPTAHAAPLVTSSGCHLQNPAPGAGTTTTTGEPRTFTMRHPSGLIGTFHFDWRLHAQTGVPSHCVTTSNVASETLQPYFYTLGLIRKTLSGPGVDTVAWQYAYEQNHASLDRFCQAGCQHTAYVDVIDPRNVTTRYTHSTRFDALEGQLLRIDHGVVDGVAAKVELIEYHTPWGVRPTVFPYGATLGGGNWYKVGDTTPVRKRTILQQGRAFIREVPSTCQPNGERGAGAAPCFDTFLRPTRTVKASVPQS